MRNPALVITAFYVLTSTIGMVVAYGRFRTWGIHVFDWWEPSDFFLAAFREPLSFVIAALAFGYALIIRRSTQLEVKRAAERSLDGATKIFGLHAPAWLLRWQDANLAWRSRNTTAIAAGFGVLIFFTLSLVFGRMSLFGGGDAPLVRVTLVQSATGPTTLDRHLLGTSNRYIFLGTTRLGGKITIVPTSSVIAIDDSPLL